MPANDFFKTSSTEKSYTWISPYILAPVFLFIGIVFRLHHLFTNRSFRLDEAALAVEIIRRSFTDIAFGVGYNMNIPTAPIGFMLSTKWMMDVSAATEWMMRGIPFVAATLALWVFFRFVRKMYAPSIDAVAIALFAFSPALIFYAADLKHYSLEVLSTVLMLWIAQQLKERPSTLSSLLGYALLGCGLMLFSFSICFMVATVVVVGIGQAVCTRHIKNVFNYFFLGLIWTAAFFGVYFNSSKQIMSNSSLFEMFDWAFLPADLTQLKNVTHFFNTLLNLFESHYAGSVPLIMLALFGIGCVHLYRRNAFYFFLAITPILITVAVSMCQKYPFYERFLLFLIPCTAIIIGSGLECLRSKSTTLAKVLTVVVLVSIFVSPLFNNIQNLSRGYNNEDTRPIMEYLVDHYQEGDAVYVNNAATNAFLFYQFQIDRPRKLTRIGRIIDYPRDGLVDVILEEHIYDGRTFKGIKRLYPDLAADFVLDSQYWTKRDQSKRVWLMFSYGKPGAESITVNSLRQVMRPAVIRREKSSHLYLFER